MKNNNFILSGICISVIQLCLFFKAGAQDFKKGMEKADTSNFSVTRHNDWQLLNSYVSLNVKGDSVQLELIALSEQKGINWKKDQYVGSIKQKQFLSKTDRVINYSLLNDLYKVKIKPDGKCYFTLEKGNPPVGMPLVIPIKVTYKL